MRVKKIYQCPDVPEIKNGNIPSPESMTVSLYSPVVWFSIATVTSPRSAWKYTEIVDRDG